MKPGIKLIGLSVLASFLIVSGTAHADGNFQKKHPRRAQVMKRDKREKNKNNQAAANGQVTKGQDRQLNREDNRVDRQEQRQAADNGGHITKGEQAKDNREMNHINQQRNHDEKTDAANGGNTTPPAPVAPASTSN